MAGYLARLGAFTFGIDTAAFQDLQRVSTYRWEAKNRIGRKPAHQNVGAGADTIRLSGVIFPHYRGGLGQIGAMRAQAETGEPLDLVYAFEAVGQYCGRWCIASIEETRTVFFADGAPRKIEFSLELVEYGDDAGAAGASVLPVSAIASAAVVSVVDTTAEAASATKAASQAAAVTSQSSALAMAASLAETAQSAASAISTTVSDVLNSDAVRLARSSVTELAKLKTAVAALKSAGLSVAAIEDAGAALGALGNLATSAGSMSDVLGTAADKLRARAGNYSGASTTSLHDKQIASASASLSGLAASASSIRAAANSLKVFF